MLRAIRIGSELVIALTFGWAYAKLPFMMTLQVAVGRPYTFRGDDHHHRKPGQVQP